MLPIAQTRMDDTVAVIKLANRPANALSYDLIEALDRALDTVTSSDARVIVFESEIEDFFVAGADLKLLAIADAAGFGRYLGTLRLLIERIASLSQLTIAVIDGMALGGGLELAMACTIRVASPTAELGVPEIKLGLLPGAGGTQRLPRLVGRGVALGLLLSGRSVTGDEAATLGLVDHVFERPVLMTEAIALARKFANGPRQAFAAIVRCVDAAQNLPLPDGLRFEGEAVRELFDTDDAREGISAFVEKRQATFE